MYVLILFYLVASVCGCETIQIHANSQFQCTDVTNVVATIYSPGTLYVWKDGAFEHSCDDYCDYEPISLTTHLHNYTFTVNGTSGPIDVQYCCYDYSSANQIAIMVISIFGIAVVLCPVACGLLTCLSARRRERYTSIV